MRLFRRIPIFLIFSLLLGQMFLVTAAYADPATRFSGFWRNFYQAKASWPMAGWEKLKLDYAYTMLGVNAAMMTPIPGVGAVYASLLVGKLDTELNTMMSGLAYMRSVPSSPEILSVAPDGGSVKVSFRRNPAEVANLRSGHYTLYYFSDSRSEPRRVETSYVPFDYDESVVQLASYDIDPPRSGSGFYAMTVTRSHQSSPPVTALKPWWMYQETLTSDPRSFWSRLDQGISSDYSAPFPYIPGPAPNLGEIDAIAVSAVSGEVYLSKPASTQILRMASNGDGLAEPKEFVNTSFMAPGQKGLAVDAAGNLFTDNAASDSSYGGRLFKFTPSGAREFTGTVNYFSQLLMYANPVAVGPICMGPNNDLLVSEGLSRQIRRVPVNATYDPYRRVGLPYYTLPASMPGQIIDMEMQQSSGSLFLLDGYGISEVPYNPATGAAGSGSGWSVKNIPIE